MRKYFGEKTIQNTRNRSFEIFGLKIYLEINICQTVCTYIKIFYRYKINLFPNY